MAKQGIAFINIGRMDKIARAQGHIIPMQTFKTACIKGFIANAIKISVSGRATTTNGGRWFATEENFLKWLDNYVPRGQPRKKRDL